MIPERCRRNGPGPAPAKPQKAWPPRRTRLPSQGLGIGLCERAVERADPFAVAVDREVRSLHPATLRQLGAPGEALPVYSYCGTQSGNLITGILETPFKNLGQLYDSLR
jgi:hypothetical protein